MRKAISVLCAGAIGLSVVAGCGKADDKQTDSAPIDSKKLNEPVTLVFKSDFADDQDKFDKSYGNKIRAKFPNVTIQFIPRGQGTTTVNELVASGINPDIMYGNITNIDQSLIGPGLAYDISELVKKNNYDIGRFEPTLIDQLKAASPEGALYGLPMPYAGSFVLFYNKSLFDKFGVPYPKDGMTWDETYELARKMTRIDNGQVYRGFSSFIGAYMRDNQLSVPYLDPKEDKLSNPDQWKKLFENLGRFYAIENNGRDPKKRSQTEEAGAFVKMNVAMQLNQFGAYGTFPPELSWDMVTIPSFKDAPNVGTQIGSNYWFITNTNKNKDISFEIIKYMVSDEMQTLTAKETGSVPSLKNSSEAFKFIGQDVPELKGKNIQALYKVKPASAPAARAKGLVGADPQKLKQTIEKAFDSYTLDNVDLNTVMRTAEEAVAKLVDEKKAK